MPRAAESLEAQFHNQFHGLSLEGTCSSTGPDQGQRLENFEMKSEQNMISEGQISQGLGCSQEEWNITGHGGVFGGFDRAPGDPAYSWTMHHS